MPGDKLKRVKSVKDGSIKRKILIRIIKTFPVS